MTRQTFRIASCCWVSLFALGACDPGQPPNEPDDTGEGVYVAQTARPPSLTKVTPAQIIAGSETELTITGRGFVPGLKVYVGGLLALPPRVVTSTKIQVEVPAGLAAAAAVPVRVVLPDGRAGERSDLFVAVADPIALFLGPPRWRFDLLSARAPAVADWNSDGRPDLAAVSLGGGITVYLSNSTGAPLTATKLPAVADAYTLTAADVNHDSKLDLVVSARTATASLQVLLGNGDGTFQAPKPVSPTAGYFSDFQHNHVTVGDPTGDGKTDVVYGDVSGDVVIVPGNGDGTFGTAVKIGHLSQPVRGVRLADLNGDGAQDVVAVGGLLGSTGSGSVLAFVRQADGTFKNTSTLTATESFTAVGLFDFDGDKKIDMATLASSGKLFLQKGGGDGTFATGVSSDVGKNGSYLTFGDLDADGRPDIVSGGRFDTSASTGETYLSLVNADGTTRSAKFDVSALYSGGMLADVNKDGRLDLVSTHEVLGEVSVTFGRGNGSFVQNGPTGIATSATSGDLNGDGKMDLIYVGSAVDRIGVMLGFGDGSFGPPATFAVDRGPSAIRTGDFDGDGKLDVVVACYDTNLVSLLLGKGDGTLAAQRTFTVGKGPNSLAVADLNADGKLDVVTANTDADSVSVLIGNGSGNFLLNKDYATGKAPVSVAVADLNTDNRLDVVTANADSNNVSYLQGSAVTAGVLNVARHTATGLAPSELVLFDANADGKIDIATVNSDSNNLAFLGGRGDGTFNSAKMSLTCEFPTDFAAGDLTGDGNVDVVVRCAAGNKSQALVGAGDGSFQASPRALILGTALHVADINADSKPDVLLLKSGETPHVLLNTRK